MKYKKKISILLSLALLIGTASFDVYAVNGANLQDPEVTETTEEEAEVVADAAEDTTAEAAGVVEDEVQPEEGAGPLGAQSGVNVELDLSSSESSIPTPGATTLHSAENEHSRALDMEWDEVPGASGYMFYIKNPTDGNWEYVNLVEGGSTTSATVKNFPVRNDAYVAIAAYVQVGKVTVQGEKSMYPEPVDIEEFLEENIHTLYYKGHTIKASSGSAGAKVFTNPGSGSWYRVANGTSVTIMEPSGGYFKCRINSTGKEGWINGDRLKGTTALYTTLDYKTSRKEDFVNTGYYGNKLASNKTYLIWCNHYTQRVNVFKKTDGKWKLYNVYRCATGIWGRATPRGYGEVKNYKWDGKDPNPRYYINGVNYYPAFQDGWFYGDGHKNLWITHFDGRNSFHTRPMTNGSSRLVEGRILAYTLGQPISLGCVRLETPNAKWIHDNVQYGTKVFQW